MKCRKSLNLQVVHHYSAPKTQEKQTPPPCNSWYTSNLGSVLSALTKKRNCGIIYTSSRSWREIPPFGHFSWLSEDYGKGGLALLGLLSIHQHASCSETNQAVVINSPPPSLVKIVTKNVHMYNKQTCQLLWNNPWHFFNQYFNKAHWV